jgi:serine/threonine protein kinase
MEIGMSSMTLDALIIEHPWLRAVVNDATLQGIQVGRLLGTGGFGSVFEASSDDWGQCVIKIAGVEFGDKEIHDGEMGPYRDAMPGSLYFITGPSLTGPLFPCAPASLKQASSLLEKACRRQQEIKAKDCPLARLLAFKSLGNRPVALFERLHAPSLRSLMLGAPDKARLAIRPIVQSLIQLHKTFGKHGDLKPDHIFVDDSSVMFIDPLGENEVCMGSLGYALPYVGRKNIGDIQDLGGMAAILAELWGGSVHWDEELINSLANIMNGRFSYRNFKVTHILDRMREGTITVPAPIRSWILDIGQIIVDDWSMGSEAKLGQARSCHDRLESLVGLFGSDGAVLH